jgi:Ca-activated chloride channel family protein
MNKNHRTLASLGFGSILCLLLAGEPQPLAQNDPSRLQVNVDLVQLSVAVTDRKGNYISGLRPEDFVITEDKIPEKISNFDEGSITIHRVVDSAPSDQSETKTNAQVGVADKTENPEPPENPKPETLSPLAGSNVFILFDTSNYMYRGFVFAQDAICDFVRSMDDPDKIAFYSYSRNLSRATLLTADRYRVVSGVRSTVAGDDAALYNSLLMTVKDAAHFTGRKAIVVFSNGPDNASSVPPEDVAELAQSTGTIIYI